MNSCMGEGDDKGLLDVNDTDNRQNIVRKLRWRVLPLMVLLSFVSYLDRTNLAFVATDMQKSLNLR